jgi:lipopolysaccharide/colanic/teichoic acid biosynthesis glycosyltransferase
MKRLFDVVASALGLIVLSPLLLLTALAVRLFDGAPVLFVQERIGRGGKPFRMYKFRTMKVNNGGPQITVGGDARITKTGRALRKTKFDEFPQLWNVLKGEMSFVGPRPEVARYVDLYAPADREILNLKPGITDPASLIYSNESEILARQTDPEKYYVEVVMPHKIAINRAYAKHANLFTDLKMIAYTVLHGLGMKLAYLDRFSNSV